LQVIHEHKKLLFPIVDREGGVAVKIIGDSLLITFRRVDSALRAMIAAQRACQAYSRHRVENERIHLSVGIGFGPILRVGDTEVFGEEVNAASKLGEDIATAGEILLTEGAREALGAMPDVEFEPIDVTLPSSQRNYRVRYEPTPAP
jgi:class 3 adenylate cyclase